LLLSVRDSAIFEKEKLINPKLRLLKDEEIKFSADRFLVNKWLFAKTNEYFRLVQDLFIITRILREFQSLRLKLNEQRASEKKDFFIKSFYFFSTELIDCF